MATLRPFRALRPRSDQVSRVAAVPYDVVNTDEARALADGNPLSFLRVSRPEIEMPPGTDPYSASVYQRASENFQTLKQTVMIVEEEPSLYLYRLRMGSHEQLGLAGCYSLDEYERGEIKKHEQTRREKEDDRTRHMIAVGAQTGPVFLTYRASADVDEIAARTSKTEPLFDFSAADRSEHTLWRVAGKERDGFVSAIARIPALYIADGHHRAASAARARGELKGRSEASSFLAVAFPHNQVQVLPYNRVVKDLGGMSPEQFLQTVRERWDVAPGPASPARRGDIAMYFNGSWYTLCSRARPALSNALGSLDVSILQDQLLAPVLGIADVVADKRIDFVGGARGTDELERLVNSRAAAVAFSMYPVSIAELMLVSDAGAMLPPKSTWFEPKLRDGLLVHLI
jgi:uncharacterized protein (DUF1015 family)